MLLAARPRLPRWVDGRRAVALAALVAVTVRLVGLTHPVRADEAGFTLVARSWDPTADSLYGLHFVDRPPLLVAVFRACDAVAGPLTVRVLGAVACGAVVLAAAWTARLVAGPRAAPWIAVCVAAVLVNPAVDAVAVKGELLGLPLVMAACGLTVLALRRGSTTLAVLAGLSACTATGMKQNLAGGLVFAAVLVLASWRSGRVPGSVAARVAVAGAAGAAVPVVTTVGWASWAGVRLDVLWYAVAGFRADAGAVLAEGDLEAPVVRAAVLVVAAVVAGLLLVLGGFVVHVRSAFADDPPLTAATAALLLHDCFALVLGGSFWRDYLFPLVPAAALSAALLLRRRSRPGRRMKVVVAASALSAVACLGAWGVMGVAGLHEHDEHGTGVAVAEAAAPGDTLVVFGGRADVQLASGLASPYEHLWSLPMRTLDPGYAELRSLLSSPDAPTWVVEWVELESWDPQAGARLRAVLEERYAAHGTGCRGRPVYLLQGEVRPPLRPSC